MLPKDILRLTLTALLICIVMACFCAMTPWVYDDFGYGSGKSTLAGIWAAQVEEYLHWSGKFVGHFLARCLLHGPVWLHPLLTPLIFTGLVFCGCLLALGLEWRQKLRAWHLLLLAGLVWFALPAFGTVFFWRTGTPDYGYSLAFATAFLLPYRFWAESHDFRLPGGPLYFVPGLLAGWSNENLGMLVLLTALAVCLYRLCTHKKLALWAGAGVAGAATGWFMLMSAPGNLVRLGTMGGTSSLPLASLSAFNKFFSFWITQQLEFVPYYLASLAVLWLLRRRGQLVWRRCLPGCIFLLMSQASLAAFVLSPSTPYRVMSASFFYAALGLFAFLCQAADQEAGVQVKSKKVPTKTGWQHRPRLALILFCCLLAASISEQLWIFAQARPVHEARLRTQQAGKSNLLMPYPQTNKYFFPCYDIREFDSSATGWQALLPWHEGQTLQNASLPSARLLTANNLVFLSGLPQGTILLGCITHDRSTENLVQALARLLAPTPAQIQGKNALLPRYKIFNAQVTPEGYAVIYARGLRSLADLAYIALDQGQNAPQVFWERISLAPPAARAAEAPVLP